MKEDLLFDKKEWEEIELKLFKMITGISDNGRDFFSISRTDFFKFYRKSTFVGYLIPKLSV